MSRVLDRIFPLDVLRGVAALSVIFWHWQHFFYVGNTPSNFDITQQPLFEQLSLLYKHGSLAVELFFCISGFIFFWLYSTEIAQHKMSASRFFMDRFSRLYPLHIATFIIVAGLQFAYSLDHSSYFIYQANDAYHALLNLLLIPAWGFEKGTSFNAPIWSVSIEFLLYIVFFFVCLSKNFRYLFIPVLIGIGYVIYPDNYKIGDGLITFFSGGVAFLGMSFLRGLSGSKSVCCVSLILAVLSWIITFFSPAQTNYLIIGLAFPASVMFIASLSFLNQNFMKPLAVIGDLSYSSYLLHFPLQIVFAMIFDGLGYRREIFYSPWMLLLFMMVLIPLSFASHRLFEVPVQQKIRTRFKAYSTRRLAL